MLNLNDVPWGLIWFAALLILWVVQGLSRVGKAAARRQSSGAQAQTGAQAQAAKAKALAGAREGKTGAEMQRHGTIIRPLVMTPQTATPVAAPSATRHHHPRHPRERPHVPSAAPYTGLAAAPLATIGLVAEAPVHHRPMLAPFWHRNRLLPAIVVGEALRPPIGLRSHEQR